LELSIQEVEPLDSTRKGMYTSCTCYEVI